MSQRALSPEKWLVNIQSVLQKFEEFKGIVPVFDDKNSFDDVLEFDINDYVGEINSRVSEEMNRRFGNTIGITYAPDQQNSRRKIVTIKVTRPESDVMDYLEKIWEKQDKILSTFALPKWLAYLLVLLAVAQLIFSLYLLNAHTQSRSDPFSLLLHWVFVQFAFVKNKMM